MKTMEWRVWRDGKVELLDEGGVVFYTATESIRQRIYGKAKNMFEDSAVVSVNVEANVEHLFKCRWKDEALSCPAYYYDNVVFRTYAEAFERGRRLRAKYGNVDVIDFWDGLDLSII